MAADRHLLFGLLALQTGLIQQAQLVAAFHAWTCDKGRSLADHLMALGHLNAPQRAAVEALARSKSTCARRRRREQPGRHSCGPRLLARVWPISVTRTLR